MTIDEASELIQFPPKSSQEVWADLGCGEGVFTKGLAKNLRAGSLIHAVDKSLINLDSNYQQVEIEFHQLDFVNQLMPFGDLDGILMANSLHYVKAKSQFIAKIKSNLKTDGRIILVEYDTNSSNQWVPYPISFEKSRDVFTSCGFSSVTKLGERKSIYNAARIYAALIS